MPAADTVEDVQTVRQEQANAVMFWLTVAATVAWSTYSMQGIVTAADIRTIKDGTVSQAHAGTSLSKWDKTAYLPMDRDFLMELAVPTALGGVFFVANFTMVYVVVAVLALLLGIAGYCVSESSVVLSGVDSIRIHDAISRWVGETTDKPDIRVMAGFLKHWCTTGSRGPLLTYGKSAFLAYKGSFEFLARTVVAQALLSVMIGLMLTSLSRIMTSRMFRNRKVSTRGLIRVVDGRSYVRRSVMMYMVSCLPTLSVLTTLAVQYMHPQDQ